MKSSSSFKCKRVKVVLCNQITCDVEEGNNKFKGNLPAAIDSSDINSKLQFIYNSKKTNDEVYQYALRYLNNKQGTSMLNRPYVDEFLVQVGFAIKTYIIFSVGRMFGFSRIQYNCFAGNRNTSPDLSHVKLTRG